MLHRRAPRWALTVSLVLLTTVLAGCSPPVEEDDNQAHVFVRDFPVGFTPGERYTYSLAATPVEGQPGARTEGSVVISIESAGGAELTLAYQGEMAGEDWSGSVTGRYDGLIDLFHQTDSGPLTDTLKETVLARLWPLYFAEQELGPGHEWEIYTEACCGGCLLEFTVEHETTVAGLRGFAGYWLAAGSERGRFCVSPEVPVPLSVTHFTLTTTYEAVLIEAEGLD